MTDRKVPFSPQHTPFPWLHHADGGTLDMPSSLSDGFKFGPQYGDVVWGPRGPGWGVVADCSPMAPCTTQSVANAKMISAVSDMVTVCEEAIAVLPPHDRIRVLAEAALCKAGRIE